MVRSEIIEGSWVSVKETPPTFNGHEATHATLWTGSAEILKKYHQYGDRIGFAQCWVFAGVLITMLRALGIPSRPVINAASGDDFEGDLTIDYEFKNGKVIFKNLNSIWNFHVWVQASMKRRDLGEKNRGWQEFDPTYNVGPVSNQVLKNAEIKTDDDIFLYAEVNSDEVFWKNRNVFQTATDKIGIQLCTATLNLKTYQDLTFEYKPRERTEKERQHYVKAAESIGIHPVSLGSPRRRRSVMTTKKTISLSIVSLEPVYVGDLVNFKIKLGNPTSRIQRLNFTLQVDSLSYNGHIEHQIKHDSRTEIINPNTNITIPFWITFYEYNNKLMSFETLRIIASVEDSDGNLYLDTKKISLLTPQLEVKQLKFDAEQIKARGESIVYGLGALSKTNSTFKKNPILVTIKFSKPLLIYLNNARISIEGNRCERKTFSIGTIGPLDHEERKFLLMCTSPNNREESLVATLISNEIDGFTGSVFANTA
ncbi:annulin-like protein [Dinothrombium tinctorium]|uniref:Annulin-like protein n=1 Tax=Dinothrombium tinctorium TaxID=1965070 RepID=A0A3S3NMM7_9ACAR|nr:annulin-like protein [Dinothrombium tinctorium]